MGFVKEFKDFAMRGNLIDMAIAVVIGTAFGKVINAFVDGIVMPMVGLLIGKANFNDIVWTPKPGVSIAFGNFLTQVLDFLIVAFAVFIVIKMMNRLKKKQEEAPAVPPSPTKDQELLTEIRDLLKK
jgi:large conductance mechanosensitive channel